MVLLNSNEDITFISSSSKFLGIFCCRPAAADSEEGGAMEQRAGHLQHPEGGCGAVETVGGAG